STPSPTACAGTASARTERTAASRSPGGRPPRAASAAENRGMTQITALAPDAAPAPSWPEPPRPAPGSPNVIVVITDDIGFGATSTFGGEVPTPTVDELADAGLRYTRFHTTAMCSPTRAALLTGRNHHRVSFGRIT